MEDIRPSIGTMVDIRPSAVKIKRRFEIRGGGMNDKQTDPLMDRATLIGD